MRKFGGEMRLSGTHKTNPQGFRVRLRPARTHGFRKVSFRSP